MAKIILNNEEFNFDGYTRNAYFNTGTENNNNVYINNIRGNNLNTRLQELLENDITSIAIKVDDQIIYTLSDIHAKIYSMDEAYNGVNAVTTNINIQFNQ